MDQSLKNTLLNIPPLKMLRAIKEKFDSIKQMEQTARVHMLNTIFAAGGDRVFELPGVIKMYDGITVKPIKAKLRIENNELRVIPDVVEPHEYQDAAHAFVNKEGLIELSGNTPSEFEIDKRVLRDLKEAYQSHSSVLGTYVATFVRDREKVTKLERDLIEILHNLVIRGDEKFTASSAEVINAVQEIKSRFPKLEKTGEMLTAIETFMYNEAKERYKLRLNGQHIHPYGNDLYGREMVDGGIYQKRMVDEGSLQYADKDEINTLKKGLRFIGDIEKVIEKEAKALNLDFVETRMLAFFAGAESVKLGMIDKKGPEIIAFVGERIAKFTQAKAALMNTVTFDNSREQKQELNEELRGMLFREIANVSVFGIQGGQPDNSLSM